MGKELTDEERQRIQSLTARIKHELHIAKKETQNLETALGGLRVGINYERARRETKRPSEN